MDCGRGSARDRAARLPDRDPQHRPHCAGARPDGDLQRASTSTGPACCRPRLRRVPGAGDQDLAPQHRAVFGRPGSRQDHGPHPDGREPAHGLLPRHRRGRARAAPSETVCAIVDEVLAFQMPGIGIPGFRRKAAEMAKAGIYDIRAIATRCCSRSSPTGRSSSSRASTPLPKRRAASWPTTSRHAGPGRQAGGGAAATRSAWRRASSPSRHQRRPGDRHRLPGHHDVKRHARPAVNVMAQLQVGLEAAERLAANQLLQPLATCLHVRQPAVDRLLVFEQRHLADRRPGRSPASPTRVSSSARVR